MFHPDDLPLISGVGVGSISSNNAIASLMKFILPNSSVSLVDQPFLWPPTTKLEAISKIYKFSQNKENNSEYDCDDEKSNLCNLLDILNLSQNFNELFQPTLLVPHPIIIKPKYEKEFLNINDAIISDFIVPSIKNALHEYPDKMPLLFEHLDKFIGSTSADPNNCDIAFASGISEILFESINSTHYDTQTLSNILNSCIKFIVQFGSSIDCFLLARAWIQSSPRPNLDLELLKKEIGYDKLPQITPYPLSIDKNEKRPLAHFFNNMSNLKVSMHSGYLYVAGKDFGVVKVGSGFNGTIPGSFLCRNISLSSFSSKFICVNDDIVIYGAYLNDGEENNDKEQDEFYIFYLDSVTLKVIDSKKSVSHENFCSCNRIIYKNDWKGKISRYSMKDKNNLKEEGFINTDFKPKEFFNNKSENNDDDDVDDNDNEKNNKNANYNDNDFTCGALDEFTNGINYYIHYPKQIIEISLQDGSFKSIPLSKSSSIIKYRYVFDSVTTQFYIIDDQGLSIITDYKTFGRIPPPKANAENPLDIIHFLTYSHQALQSRFHLSPSFNLLFPLIQSIVPLNKINSKSESKPKANLNTNLKLPLKPPEFIPSPRLNSTVMAVASSSNSNSNSNQVRSFDEFIDFSPILLEASTQSLKNGNVLPDDLFNIFLERLNFFYEKCPVVTLAFIATYLTSEETANKSEVIFQNKIDFSILFEAASQLPCLHQAYVFYFLSNDKSLKAIWELFENLDHKGVAFLNVLSESLAFQLTKNAAVVLNHIQRFINLIHYSKSPLFYSFLESFFYVFQEVTEVCLESAEMLIRVLPFLTDPMKANTINDYSTDLNFNENESIIINKSDVLSLNNLQLSSDIPISTNQDTKVSRLVRIFDLELPVTSKIYIKFCFQQKITCDQLCLVVYTTKSQKEHEAFLPASGSAPTDKIEVEFNSSYIAVDVNVVENNTKDSNNNDENGNNNNTIEFTYSLACTIPILTATETLMNMNIFQLYWCKALLKIKQLLSESEKQLSLTNSNDEKIKKNSKQITQQLFDVVFQNIPHNIYHKIFNKFRNIDISLINTENNIKFIQSKLKSKNFNERLFYLSIASRLLDSFSSDELMNNWRELFITFSFVMNKKKNLQERENEQQVFYKILSNYHCNSNPYKIGYSKSNNFRMKSNVDFGFELDLNLHLDCFISISEFQKYADNQFSYIIYSISKQNEKKSQIGSICKVIFELMNMIDQSSIPIITSNMIIITKAISFLPTNSTLVDKKFIKNLILSHLTKCIDDSLELVFLYENIFSKFGIEIDEIDDLVTNVLESVEVTQGNLENKYYFQCCRFLRHFMTVEALNSLNDFIEHVEPLPISSAKNGDDNDDNKSIESDITNYNYKGTCLGALMILSSRYSPISINDKYIMCSNRDQSLYNRENNSKPSNYWGDIKDDINLVINDYNCLIFSFETDDGMILLHPPFDFHTYLPLFDNSFYQKVPEKPLPKLSNQLVKNVVNQLNGKYKSLAIDALCDLSINSFNEPLKYLDFLEEEKFYQKVETTNKNNFLIEIENKPTPHFVIDDNDNANDLVQMQEAYKTNSTKRSKFKKSKEFSIFLRSFFSAKHKPANVVFFDQPGTDFKIILSRYDKYKLLLNDDHNREICIWSITDHFIASVLPGSKSSIIECYFGISPTFQIVYLKLGSHFWVNPVQYTPDMKKVRLGVVGDEYTFDAFVIDTPPDLLVPTLTPQYLLIDNGIKTFEKFEKISKKPESDILLLPFLKNEGQLFYMEVTYNCKHMKFSLSPSFMSSLLFYSYELPSVENSVTNQTVGIIIDFTQNLVGVKSENKVIKESVMSFDYLPYVCLLFHHDEAKTVEFNFGTKPFLYLFRSLPSKSSRHCTVEYTNDDSNDKFCSYRFSPTIQTPFKPTGLSFPIEIGRPAFLNRNSKPLIGMIRNDRFLTSTLSTTIPLFNSLIKDLKDSFIINPDLTNLPNSQFLLNLASPTSSSSSTSSTVPRLNSKSPTSRSVFPSDFLEQFMAFIAQSNDNHGSSTERSESNETDHSETENENENAAASVIEEEEEELDDEIMNDSSFVDFFTNDNNCIIKTTNCYQRNQNCCSLNDLMLWSTPFDSVDNVEIATVHSLFFLRDRIDPQYNKEFSRLARRALNEYDGNFCNPHNLTIKNYELDLSHKSEIIIHIFMNLAKSDKGIEYFNQFDSFHNKLLIQAINSLATVDLRTDFPFSNLLFELIKSPYKNASSPKVNRKIECGNIKFVRHYLIESAKMFTNIQILMHENGKYRSIHATSIGNFERISDMECDAMIFLTTRIGNNKKSKIKLVDKYQNKISMKSFYDHKSNIIDYKTNYNCIQTLLRGELIFDKIRYHDSIMCSFVPIEFRHPENLIHDDVHSFRKSYCDYYMKQKESLKLTNQKSEIKYTQKVGFAFAIHFINHVYEYIKRSSDKVIANMFNKYFLRPVFYELVYKKACVFDRYVAKWMSILITHRQLFTEQTIVSYKSVKTLSHDKFQFDQFPYNELSYVIRLMMIIGDCYVSKHALAHEVEKKCKEVQNNKKQFDVDKSFKEVFEDKENSNDNNNDSNYDYNSDDEFEENGLCFTNFYRNDNIDKIDEEDEIDEVVQQEKNENNDSNRDLEQRRRISSNFIIDSSLSKRAVSIYKAVAAELLNPLGCHLPFFKDIIQFPFLTQIITSEFFKCRPDLKPPTITISVITPNIPYIHKAKKGSIPIIYGNPPSTFRIHGYENSPVDRSFFEPITNNNNKDKSKKNNNNIDYIHEFEIDSENEYEAENETQNDTEEMRNRRRKIERNSMLNDFNHFSNNSNDDLNDDDDFCYFIITNSSSLPIPTHFQVSFLSNFIEARNLPDGRKLNQLNCWLFELKTKWNLHYEAICFFIHTLLNSFKCNFVNFKIFEPIIKNIFPTISSNAALFQLMMTSFRMRTGFRFRLIYNYELEDDLFFINLISPDCIKIPKDYYKRSIQCSSSSVNDTTETTATAITTTISSDISSVVSSSQNNNNNNNINNELNQTSGSSLSIESNNNNNNNLARSSNRSRNNSSSSFHLHSNSSFNLSSLSASNNNIICNDSTGKKISDFYINASKSFDFCFPHNYKEFAPLSESILSSYTDNDLFTNDHYRHDDGRKNKKRANSEWEVPAFLPRASACSKREIEAFVSFGTHLVVAFEIGSAVPFIVSRVVIRYAFDCKLILDDFADIDLEFSKSGNEEMIQEKIRPIKKQLDAIRMGVLRMRPIKYHSYFNIDYFPRVFQMMPFVDVLQLIEGNANIRPFIVFKAVLAITESIKERAKRDPISKNCIL